MEASCRDGWVLARLDDAPMPTRGCDGPYPLYSVVDVETRSSTADVSASPPTSTHSIDRGNPARTVKVQQRERVEKKDCRAAKRAQTKEQAELKRIKGVVGTQPIADHLRV
eukprot:scaffold93688_cov69-Phaeocystis_antarctica.AAC.1